MKTELVFTVALIAVALTVSIYILADLRRIKRFADHRLVRAFVERLSEAMIQKSSQHVVSNRERFLVVTEHVNVSDESILCDICSVFFSHERMCLLHTRREKRLMARAIAEQTKKRMIAKCSSLGCRRFQINTTCNRVLNDPQKSFLVRVYYITPNEAYIQDERW